jgi:hypothetical protein
MCQERQPHPRNRPTCAPTAGETYFITSGGRGLLPDWGRQGPARPSSLKHVVLAHISSRPASSSSSSNACGSRSSGGRTEAIGPCSGNTCYWNEATKETRCGQYLLHGPQSYRTEYQGRGRPRNSDLDSSGYLMEVGGEGGAGPAATRIAASVRAPAAAAAAPAHADLELRTATAAIISSS